eukprot:TRINITY_DN42973_c0_g1_i1.p1 TRINITY_DN42973_c0_g1~~TRINITY_DN42973_c0_g1_i1.p1  ORF type:complete len:572 (-),score=96.88 TRINITY_DN42973_c0_g1_i1:59-1774(-)
MGNMCSTESTPELVSPRLAGLQAQLRTLLEERPYLERKVNPLNQWVTKCRTALDNGVFEAAEDSFDRLQTVLRLDVKRLEAAFKKFDLDGSGQLEISEFRHFVTYVGFGPEVVDAVLKESDRDNDGNISLTEFEAFAGRVGGIGMLLSKRRRALDDSGGTGDTIMVGSRVRSHYLVDGKISKSVWDARVIDICADGKTVKLEFSLGVSKRVQDIPRNMIEDDVDLLDALAKIGVMDDTHHYWTLLLPMEEQHAVKALVDCQQKALSQVRTLATKSHEDAVQGLLARCEKIGIMNVQLWSILTWIRDLAPIIIMINLDDIGKFLLEDTHYRNQFETQSSGGLLSTGTRGKWEHDLFGGSYDDAEPFDRPKYGVLDVMNDHRGVVCARQYGDSYLYLKNVRLVATFAPEDSGGIQGKRLAVLDQYAHVLMEYSDAELKEVCRVANAPEGSEDRIGNSEAISSYNYKEAQFHGEVSLDKHVRRLVVHPKHRVDGISEEKIRDICIKHKWEFMWMDDERKRRIFEEHEARDSQALEVSWRSSAVGASPSAGTRSGSLSSWGNSNQRQGSVAQLFG